MPPKKVVAVVKNKEGKAVKQAVTVNEGETEVALHKAAEDSFTKAEETNIKKLKSIKRNTKDQPAKENTKEPIKRKDGGSGISEQNNNKRVKKSKAEDKPKAADSEKAEESSKTTTEKQATSTGKGIRVAYSKNCMGCKNSLKYLTEALKNHPDITISSAPTTQMNPRVFDIFIVNDGKEQHIHNREKDGSVIQKNVGDIVKKIQAAF